MERKFDMPSRQYLDLLGFDFKKKKQIFNRGPRPRVDHSARARTLLERGMQIFHAIHPGLSKGYVCRLASAAPQPRVMANHASIESVYDSLNEMRHICRQAQLGYSDFLQRGKVLALRDRASLIRADRDYMQREARFCRG
jgi:hypothetical protein